MDIDDATFVVTDTETTGLRPGPDRVIEIGAVKIVGGQITDRFSELVNPMTAVPRQIVRLTGITSAMVAHAQAAQAVLPRFLDFLGEGVFVGHNVAFDRKFLQSEIRSAGLDFWIGRGLCTKRIARRLLHALPSRSLGSLIRHYGISVRRRHRALDDAEATAEVFLRLLTALRNETGISTVEELARFQFSRHDRHRTVPANIRRIRSDYIGMLPETPGVYLFKDSTGHLLYVGKARNIRSRVRSYFVGIDTHPTRIRRLAKAVRDVDFIPTPSELSALVLESRLIKGHQPRYNRAEVRYRNLPFVRVDPNDKQRPVSWSFEIHPDGADYFGPLQNRSEAEMLVKIARRYPTVFTSGIDDVVSQIEIEMRDAAARLEFERAGDFRDEIAFLRAFGERPYRAGFSVLDHNAVWIERSESRDECTILGIRRGRLGSDLTVSVPMTDADREALNHHLKQLLVTDSDHPSPYRRPEIDEIRIIASWLYRKRERLEVVPVVSDDSTGDVLDRVEASIRRAS